MGVSGTDFGIRKGLVDRGVSDADIGFNKSNGWVTIGDKDFIKAPKNYNGTTYTTEQDFNSAWNTHQKSNQQPDPNRFNAMQMNPSGVTGRIAAASNQTPQAQANPGYTPFNTNNPYDPKFDALLSTLLNQANNPTPVDVNAIYASPQWAAYQQNAEKSAQQGIRAAQESMGTSGFGRSTALGERAQGIQNDATSYLNTQVLPQLMSQAQAEQQQKLQNQMAVLGQLGNQQGVFDTRFNNANNLAIDQGQLTGKYLSPEARSTIDQIIGLGEAWKTGTPEQRTQLSSEANRLRGKLQNMGVDPSQFGANLTTEQRQANVGGAGVKTMQSQTLDWQKATDERDFAFTKAQQEWDNNFKSQQFSWDKAQTIWERTFQEKNFQQSVKDAAASRGLQWSSLNQQQQHFIADSAFREKQFKLQQDQFGWTKDPANPDNMPKGKSIDAIASFIDSAPTAFTTNGFGSMATKIPNLGAIETMILQSGLSPNDMAKLYSRYGIPMK